MLLSLWVVDFDRLIQGITKKEPLRPKGQHYHNRDVKEDIIKIVLFKNKLCAFVNVIFP